MKPYLIRSTLDESVTTWVPYGISVDISDWTEELRRTCNALIEEYKSSAVHPPAS